MEYIDKIIGAVAGLITATFAYFKYFHEKSPKRTRIFKAVQGNYDIDMILADITKSVKNVVKAGLIETTNGGGIPQVGRMTYKRVMNCTDPNIFYQFGEKTPNDAAYNKIILETLVFGETKWSVKDMTDPQVKALFEATGVSNGVVILCAIENDIRLLATVVDFHSDYVPTVQEMYYMRNQNQKIKNILRK